MFLNKKRLLVAITTFNHDALRVSIPLLARIGHRVSVLIYNDNPDVKLTKKTVRKIGWRGPLQIINGPENLGEIGAKIKLIDICAKDTTHKWVTFMDDDDMLVSIDIPQVSDDVFAILQNVAVVQDSHTELFKKHFDWNKNSLGPNFDIRGTWVRPMYLDGFSNFMESLMPQFNKIARGLKYRLPVGAILWAGLNAFVKSTHPKTQPIYMNKTNYVSIRLGTACEKYGTKNSPSDVRADFSKAAVEKFTELFDFAIKQNVVAQEQ